MELPEFLEKLAATKSLGRWYLLYGRLIRNESYYACPITMLTRQHCGKVDGAAELLGLSLELRNKIAAVADGWDNGHDHGFDYHELRRQLLEAVGLQEANDAYA